MCHICFAHLHARLVVPVDHVRQLSTRLVPGTEHGYKTVKTRFWPWLSGTSPLISLCVPPSLERGRARVAANEVPPLSAHGPLSRSPPPPTHTLSLSLCHALFLTLSPFHTHTTHTHLVGLSAGSERQELVPQADPEDRLQGALARRHLYDVFVKNVYDVFVKMCL